MQPRQRTAVLALDRKIYFEFLKRLVSILKLLQLLIFSFVKKDALLGILVPATVEAHASLTSRRPVFSFGVETAGPFKR